VSRETLRKIISTASKIRGKWQGTQEDRVIKRHGGNPSVRMGADGSRNGRPLEVKSVKKDDRYRINQDNHRAMVRKDGTYIFVDEHGHTREVSARAVSTMIGGGPWYKDRTYPHKFVGEEQVF